MLQTSKPIRRTKYPAPSFFDPASITTRFYGHKLVGHCLDPVFKDGDMVVFDSEAELENGCFAVCYYRPELVKLGHHSALLKRLVAVQVGQVSLEGSPQGRNHSDHHCR